MKIIILGADGFLGFSTALYFAKRGHTVLNIDNYLKRKFALEVNEQPLFPIQTLQNRTTYWNTKYPNNKMSYKIGDITHYEFLYNCIKEFNPDCIVHYAEQPSSPWSMFSYENGRRTIENNLIGTYNLLWAVKELNRDITIIKLGTSGEYECPNTAIPADGFLEYEYKGRKDRRLYPRSGPSIYHTTKVNDTDLIWFFCRVFGLKVYDSMQAPVIWDIPAETEEDINLYPPFYYSELFGTVAQRFIVQAVSNLPLSIYGKGNQARGFLSINDTIQCIYLFATTPINAGELRIYHQMTTTMTINELADLVIAAGSNMGLTVQSNHVDNPRVENESVKFYQPEYTTLFDLGLTPHHINQEMFIKLINFVLPYKNNINYNTIYNNYKWR